VWVASFVGDAVLLPAAVRDGIARTALGDLTLTGADGAEVGTAMLRPEQLKLARPGTADGVTATVVRRDYHGHDSVLALRLDGGAEVAARIAATDVDVSVGDTVTVRVQGPARLYPTG
jgi:iron(III) transport system ATP-binding protein